MTIKKELIELLQRVNRKIIDLKITPKSLPKMEKLVAQRDELLKELLELTTKGDT